MFYTVETLQDENPNMGYLSEINQSDVDYVNALISLIENKTDNNKPVPSDVVEVTMGNGDYFSSGRIESYDEDSGDYEICSQPYTPFAFANEELSSISYSMSGGLWSSVKSGFKLIGKRDVLFKIRPGGIPYGNTAIQFRATVNAWEYKEPDPLYGDYTTKDYRKQYIHRLVDSQGNPKDESGYRFFGKGIAFRTKEDYVAWLRTFRGEEFAGGSENSRVVFFYKERDHLISLAQWKALDLPRDTRMINGINLVKVKYDDANKVVDTYRYTNGGELDWRKYKPYELARGRSLDDIVPQKEESLYEGRKGANN